MSARVVLGFLLLILAALGALGYALVQNGTLATAQEELGRRGLWQRYEPLTLRGAVAGDKIGLLDDPELRAYLRSRYNLQLEVTRAGSLEMVRAASEQRDFLWPAGEVALELYKARNGPLAGSETILSSPLVFYSWDAVVPGLEANGLVARVADRYYAVDLAGLSAAMLADKQWSELGVPDLHGPVRVVAADPARSGSGSQFAGLLANTMNGGAVVDELTIDDHLPPLRRYFASLGLQPGSSAELFARYLRQGPGAYPIVVGYESQLIEHALKNRQQLPMLGEKVRVLYPRPTVWSSHPLLLVNGEARRLAEALADPEVQRLAARHGFRTALGGTWSEAGALPIAGLADTVDNVTALPNAAVMARIVEALGFAGQNRGNERGQ